MKTKRQQPHYQKAEIFEQQNPSPVVLNVLKKDTEFINKSALKLIGNF